MVFRAFTQRLYFLEYGCRVSPLILIKYRDPYVEEVHDGECVMIAGSQADGKLT